MRGKSIRLMGTAMKMILAAVLGTFLFVVPAFAGNAAPDTEPVSDDSLFGGGIEIISAAEETPGAESPEKTLLFPGNGVEIGGSYEFTLSPGWTWNPETSFEGDNITDSLETELSALVFFSARPSEDFRVYGEAELSSPFLLADDDPDTPLMDEGREFDDIVRITELFSDFHIADAVFFRAGKQTINWGVGYFFSPADLLNLSEIDPENPEAEPEGPISVKVNIPVGIDNIYGYVIVPDGSEDLTDLAYAAKFEMVAGSSEFGVGGYYRNGQSPAVMLTYTGSLANVSLYAEGMASYGSDRTFIVEDADTVTGYSTASYDDRWFFQATVGAMYVWNDDETDFGLTLAAQYLYNGTGYVDPDPVNTSVNAAAIAALLASGSIAAADLVQTGTHYGAALASLALTEDVSVSLFWLGNMSDLSGLLKCTLSWSVTDDIHISAGLPYTYGAAGTEYSPFGSRLGLTLGFGLGSGKF